jgi:exosortase K
MKPAPFLRALLPYYVAVVGIFVALQFAYNRADTDNLRFFLAPTDYFVSLITTSSSVYTSEKGYTHSDLHIVIEKSCSGFNFFTICFTLLAMLFFIYAKPPTKRIFAIPFALALAYVVTIVVNVSRILFSIVAQTQADQFLGHRPHLRLHDYVGFVHNIVALLFVLYLSKILLIRYFK